MSTCTSLCTTTKSSSLSSSANGWKAGAQVNQTRIVFLNFLKYTANISDTYTHSLQSAETKRSSNIRTLGAHQVITNYFA
jgi:hypothetical protein